MIGHFWDGMKYIETATEEKQVVASTSPCLLIGR